MTHTKFQNSEAGSTLIELLVAILIIGLLGMASVQNQVMALQAAKLTEANHAASSIVISRIEELAAVRTTDVDSSFNETDTPVTWNSLNFTFLRSTTVTVNADGSRDITVTANSDNEHTPTEVEFETTFAPWD